MYWESKRYHLSIPTNSSKYAQQRNLKWPAITHLMILACLDTYLEFWQRQVLWIGDFSLVNSVALQRVPRRRENKSSLAKQSPPSSPLQSPHYHHQHNNSKQHKNSHGEKHPGDSKQFLFKLSDVLTHSTDSPVLVANRSRRAALSSKLDTYSRTVRQTSKLKRGCWKPAFLK